MAMRAWNGVILLVLASTLAGCSVVMATAGKPDPATSSLDLGQSRDIVLLNLGEPSQTNLTDAGRVDTFDLERGNQPSIGRAIGHAFLDLITLGLWELAGTPLEAISGESFRLTITYDNEDKVTKVTTGAIHNPVPGA